MADEGKLEGPAGGLGSTDPPVEGDPPADEEPEMTPEDERAEQQKDADLP